MRSAESLPSTPIPQRKASAMQFLILNERNSDDFGEADMVRVASVIPLKPFGGFGPGH